MTAQALRDGPSALLRVRKLLSDLILRSERSERLEGWQSSETNRI
jgi:hypothetical protein